MYSHVHVFTCAFRVHSDKHRRLSLAVTLRNNLKAMEMLPYKKSYEICCNHHRTKQLPQKFLFCRVQKQVCLCAVRKKENQDEHQALKGYAAIY